MKNPKALSQSRPAAFDLAEQFFDSLCACEKLTPEQLVSHQHEVATTLLQHVEKHIPFYAERLQPIRDGRGGYDFSRWREIPILTKADVKRHYNEILADEHLPVEHGALVRSESSATTGIPLSMPRTQLTDLAVACSSFRHGDAHGIDTAANLVMIRALRRQPRQLAKAENPEAARWGKPWVPAHERGQRAYLSINTHPAKQLELLKEMAPAYLNTLPSNAINLARYMLANNVEAPEIRGILTVGERLSEEMRTELHQAFGCKAIDVYSTSECGSLAQECPLSGGYHLQSELALIEIINESGKPCQIGETGRVVATPFFNLAMPLIRYQFEDYVTLAPPCPCGRPAPLIGAIHGRRDGLMHLSDKRRGHPPIEAAGLRKYLGRCRWQLVQTDRKKAELRYMQTPEGEKVDEREAAAYVQRLLGRDIRVYCRESAAIGPTPGGKFLRIKNEIAGQ